MKRILYLTFAALLLMAVSCKKDKLSGGNTLTIDGVSLNITEASVCQNDLENGNYQIYLYLPDYKVMIIMLSGKTHLGKTIDLTKKDASDTPGWYWAIMCYTKLASIDADGNANGSSPVFTSGTLFSERLSDKGGKPVMHLELKNGIFNGHTVSLHFKGKVEPFYE